VHDALISFGGEPTEIALRRMAEGLALDADAILDHMSDDTVTAEIMATRGLAQRLQINGTPSFVMQDQLLRGYLTIDQMLALVSEKRAQ